MKPDSWLPLGVCKRFTQPLTTFIWTAEYTACGHRMAHRKWKETKLQPGTAGPGNMLGCCLVSFHFLWAILSTSTVHAFPDFYFSVTCVRQWRNSCKTLPRRKQTNEERSSAAREYFVKEGRFISSSLTRPTACILFSSLRVPR